MALYDTKKAFSDCTFFGETVQKLKKRFFGGFSQRKKADTHWVKAVDTAFGKVRAGFGLSLRQTDVQREYAQERRRLCQKERKYSFL